jgi:hypothetical protein
MRESQPRHSLSIIRQGVVVKGESRNFEMLARRLHWDSRVHSNKTLNEMNKSVTELARHYTRYNAMGMVSRQLGRVDLAEHTTSPLSRHGNANGDGQHKAIK